DGGNLAARAHMLAAASMGATAFQKGLGAIHSLSHPIGAIYDTHHGLTNAVVMPYVLAFNRPAVADKMERLAAWLGLAQPSFQAVQDWILGLRSALSIPHSLREIGVGDDRLEEIAEMAAVDPTAPTNPLPLDPKNLRAMMENALEGRVD
ncbi:MAG: iron-containing alcohol dehydrogenase, partial [Kiloniellales bacterium]|nr:iron-containing alcohol dehydrogenase [Kiloniellales bacterium]